MAELRYTIYTNTTKYYTKRIDKDAEEKVRKDTEMNRNE